MLCTSPIFGSRHNGHCRTTSQYAEYGSHFYELRIMRLCQFLGFSTAKDCTIRQFFKASGEFGFLQIDVFL